MKTENVFQTSRFDRMKPFVVEQHPLERAIMCVYDQIKLFDLFIKLIQIN